ncbi:MAG: SDR family NAD(P)-dependent oxidoreductase [Hyphomicrobiaceae bacterium TMED74]|nr:oxidoreductase [Filomicrobium sp.]RPG41695.1 MAG: SDR family NAD(P)-dependent oxidoreductase [Hyphomicrobiaceae bacterium TMED74]
MSKTALIVGTGSGISASFARLLAREGYKLALTARNTDKLSALASETGAATISCDATKIEEVNAVFDELDCSFGEIGVVLYNPSQRVPGTIVDLPPADVAQAINISAFGGFLVAQEAAKRMIKQGHGNILFTGASASVKGYARSTAFAMGKFALRGLAQSLARELAPQNIHVAHFVIDGGVRNPEKGRQESASDPVDKYLDPDAIAETYLSIVNQPRSAWTWEVELRPWVENF